MSYKVFCDLCGKQIQGDNARQFKIRERHYSFHESWWMKLDTHDQCVQAVISAYRAQKETEKSQEGT